MLIFIGSMLLLLVMRFAQLCWRASFTFSPAPLRQSRGGNDLDLTSFTGTSTFASCARMLGEQDLGNYIIGFVVATGSLCICSRLTSLCFWRTGVPDSWYWSLWMELCSWLSDVLTVGCESFVCDLTISSTEQLPCCHVDQFFEIPWELTTITHVFFSCVIHSRIGFDIWGFDRILTQIISRRMNRYRFAFTGRWTCLEAAIFFSWIGGWTLGDSSNIFLRCDFGRSCCCMSFVWFCWLRGFYPSPHSHYFQENYCGIHAPNAKRW